MISSMYDLFLTYGPPGWLIIKEFMAKIRGFMAKTYWTLLVDRAERQMVKTEKGQCPQRAFCCMTRALDVLFLVPAFTSP